ncbi:MAG: DUF4349 domain-containing protein [Halobacteria archaeon]
MDSLGPLLRRHWKFAVAAAAVVVAALAAFSATAPRGALGDGGFGEYGAAYGKGVPEGIRTMPAPAPARMADIAGEAPVSGGERKIITSGSIGIEVANVSTALDALTALATRHNGFVGAATRSISSAGVPSGSVTLRVPNASFPAVLSEVRRLGRVLSENIQGEDITEQFVDLEARLNNAKAQEKRYLALLDRAQNVSDLLAVERELGRIRSDIESMQGRLNLLANRAEMATLVADVAEPTSLAPPAPGQSAFDTVKAAVGGFLAMVGALVVAGATLLPLAVVVWAGWKIYRKRSSPPGAK